MELLAQQIKWQNLLDPETALKITLLMVLGFPLLAALSALAGRSTRKRMSAQSNMLLRKGIFYIGSIALILSVLQQLEFKMGALLGAAGVVGIALGFASQTSVSNIISGLFLVSERPFEVGDLIRVGDTTGVVLSIDLMSVKLRTFDNQYVRLPNENLIKTQVNNLTHFPIRRLDIDLGVAYKEDIEHVKRVLTEVARNNPHCLDEPEPLILFRNLGDSALEFLFAVWSTKEDYLQLKKTILQEVKERFDAESIEIPFPHRTLYTGSVTDPLPIRLITEVNEETTT
ncbi:mechanosensitive ion channel family protein [Planctomycetota bacterium]